MIRPARPDDVESILGLIRELAVYEELEHHMDVTADALREDLFGGSPRCEALIAEADDGTTAGYALFFPTYSTFKTRRCLHLEDVYVTPDARGRGHGKALLATVATIARDRGCPRLDWNVLSWNQPAIDFYGELGAEVLSDWWLCRLEGDSLVRVASLADKIK
jgi:GNAT superfamily N-acetyltransferase